MGRITGTELSVTSKMLRAAALLPLLIRCTVCGLRRCCHSVYIHSTTYCSEQLSYVLERVQSGNSYMTNKKTQAICIVIHMITSSIRHFPCYQWRGP